ncbi:MAG: enoyl-CoA hydratase/isomerase family protein [Planctomycetes bacterium]|nr:enoyl-CoA hydratase/isomerase family protein [Planctomycetota bacterium]
MMESIRFEVDECGIARVTIDQPGEKVNKFDEDLVRALGAVVADLREKAVSGAIRAVLFRSSKPGVFIAGADIRMIEKVVDPALAAQGCREGQRVFQLLEDLPVPTVAAIDGACLGGGYEFALACRYRIASDAPHTKIGLPEVKLGLFPAWGGTQRLPRAAGLRNALDVILAGKMVDGKRAEKMGLVHACAPAALVEDVALDYARRALTSSPPPVRGRRRLSDLFLEMNPLGRRFVCLLAARGVRTATRGFYPAPLAALGCVRAGVEEGPEAGYAMEAKRDAELAVGPVCKNLIGIFFLQEKAKKATGAVDVPVEPAPVRRIGVLGAGVMGAGIAQLAADRGVQVRLRDVDTGRVAAGLSAAAGLFRKEVEKRRLSRHQAENGMALLSGTTDLTGFRHADLVIEAVVEDLEVKRQVFREIEGRAGGQTILASNTSSISIAEMARSLERPEHFVGMHFFNPVHRMPLVEVIRGPRTSAATVATTVAFAKALGKTPIVVADGPGFLVNRILMHYMNEASHLFAQGVPFEIVDRIIEEFGMPMGPFALLDEVGLDVAAKAARVMAGAYGNRILFSTVLDRAVETGRLGKKAGRGFYRKRGEPDPAALKEFAGLRRAEPVEVEPSEIVDRLVLSMANEASRCLGEGIVADAETVDLGMIFGTGFPPFRGGLLRYADSLGLPAVVKRLERLAEKLGPRFRPDPLLTAKAVDGTTFREPLSAARQEAAAAARET